MLGEILIEAAVQELGRRRRPIHLREPLKDLRLGEPVRLEHIGDLSDFEHARRPRE
jgi:hypothetical protein